MILVCTTSIHFIEAEALLLHRACGAIHTSNSSFSLVLAILFLPGNGRLVYLWSVRVCIYVSILYTLQPVLEINFKRLYWCCTFALEGVYRKDRRAACCTVSQTDCQTKGSDWPQQNGIEQIPSQPMNANKECKANTSTSTHKKKTHRHITGTI